MSENAVGKIYEAKGRPADNPCIVHVDGRTMLDRVAGSVPQKAERLIQKFWPGPLTLVLERSPEVAPSVSAGLTTVAARMPANRIALELIACGEHAHCRAERKRIRETEPNDCSSRPGRPRRANRSNPRRGNYEHWNRINSAGCYHRSARYLAAWMDNKGGVE